VCAVEDAKPKDTSLVRWCAIAGAGEGAVGWGLEGESGHRSLRRKRGWGSRRPALAARTWDGTETRARLLQETARAGGRRGVKCAVTRGRQRGNAGAAADDVVVGGVGSWSQARRR
jgi:hypothetical protein